MARFWPAPCSRSIVSLNIPIVSQTEKVNRCPPRFCFSGALCSSPFPLFSTLPQTRDSTGSRNAKESLRAPCARSYAFHRLSLLLDPFSSPPFILCRLEKNTHSACYLLFSRFPPTPYCSPRQSVTSLPPWRVFCNPPPHPHSSQS